MKVENGFNLKGKILDLNIEVLDFKAYFLTPTTKKQMSNSVKLVTDLIMKAVNYQLDHGIILPLPYTLRSDLSKS